MVMAGPIVILGKDLAEIDDLHRACRCSPRETEAPASRYRLPAMRSAAILVVDTHVAACGEMLAEVAVR